MKKPSCILAVFIVAVTLIVTVPAGASEPILIGISKIVAHPALDAIEKGIQEVVRATILPNLYLDFQREQIERYK